MSGASTATSGAGGTSASSPTASRPTAGDVDRGTGTLGVRSGAGDASTSGSEGTSERQLDLESVRGDRPAGATGQVRGVGAQTTGGARAGSAVAGRGQGARGPSPWLAGAENPFAMMRRMQDDLDRVFRTFGIPRLATLAPARELEELFARSPALTQAAEWSPQVEVLERGDSLVVRADLPGVKRDDVEVNVENDVLTIRGERRQERSETEGGYRRSERSYGTFFRQIPLPEDVEPSQIEASYEDGVLEVRIPSARDQQRSRRRIEIR
ncbi:MAG: Hsp20 family protein [Gemmatimonadaceae bacterium]